MIVLITALTLRFLIAQNDAARILAVFPVPSFSHQVVFRPLMQELVRRGHSVTIVTPNPAFANGKTPANLTEIDVHDISYNSLEEIYISTSSVNYDVIEKTRVIFQMIARVSEMQLNVDRVKNIIQNEKFDLLFLEACAKFTIILTHVLKIPVIQISSFGPMIYNVKSMGALAHPFLYPNLLTQRLYNLTKWEKLMELWNFYRHNRMFNEIEETENEMAKKMFGSNVPTIRELLNNVDMMFLNIHPLWEGNYPVPPSVIYMGGMHQKPEKELPKDWKTFIDSSKNGVIFMSLGTNIKPSLLPTEKVQMFVNVFAKLPYDVIWKWDTEDLPGRSVNIRISKWLPQSDLLRHPKVKVFITQGGLQSIDEAITAGVPLIGFPMLGDQWYNVEKCVHHQIGMKLDMDTFTERELRDALNTVIKDESYRRNVVKLRSIIYDQPQRPLERAVWWTEYVLRHRGAKHLRAPGANITWAQYLELDLVLTLLAIVFGMLTVLFSFVYYSHRLFFHSRGNLLLKTD